MMARKYILVSILIASSLAGCASDPWTKTDTAMYAAYLGAVAYDGVTTSKSRHYPCIHESGVIAKHVIGEHPDAANTWQYMGTTALGTYLISRALPSTWRKVWLAGNTIEHGLAGYNNQSIIRRGCNGRVG